MDIIGWVLVIAGGTIAAALTKWFKAAQQVKLVKDILNTIADGEITKEELEKIVADIKELVEKKKK